MGHQELAKLYHMDHSSSRDKNLVETLNARLNSESTFKTGFVTPNGEAFLVVTREISAASERIFKTECLISSKLNGLSEIAKRAILRSMVLDEVVCTNLVEDIHSTRRQIKDAIDAEPNSNVEFKRFKELATLYLGIIDGTGAFPLAPKDIRAVHDKVTEGKIPQDKIPDGQLFRKEGVAVTAGGVRVTHRGIEPESKIIEAMNLMLDLMNNDQVPLLYSSLASHYIFEYTHPFYDGNGRTGRYLLSLSLSDVLSSPTAISLSRTIAENKESYYRSFKSAENELNHAELTFFISTMLNLIERAQEGVVERLDDSLDLTKSINETIARASADFKFKSKELDIVNLLLQYEAFGLFGSAPLKEIATSLGLGTQQTRKYLASLESQGVCRKLNNYSPITFGLSDKFKECYGVSNPIEE